MQQCGYSFHEYIVGSPQSYIRHSTTEINDGRQSFGVLGTVSFIQEGRKWRTLEDQLERGAKSQLASVEALLRICATHAEDIRRIIESERRALSVPASRTVALRMDHVSSTNEMVIPVQQVQTSNDTPQARPSLSRRSSPSVRRHAAGVVHHRAAGHDSGAASASPSRHDRHDETCDEYAHRVLSRG
ncbi:MAG: hypothetical protein C4326_03735 [Ignavibacteria bacterium]